MLTGGAQAGQTLRGAKGTLPPNVARPLEAGDVVLLNLHMINTTEEPLDSCFKINLHGIPAEQVELEAGELFFYNAHIALPPGSRGSARMACPILEDATLLTAVSHMHARGVAAQARLWDGMPADPDAQPIRDLYDETRWEEPPRVDFDKPIALKQGQWIEWSCDYENTEARPVAQGAASTDEMCMFLGTYYPKNLPMERCADPSTGTAQLNGINLADGTLDGQEFLDCLLGSPLVFSGAGDDPERYETLRCFTETCAAVSPLTQPFLQCLAAGEPAACQDLREELKEATCDGAPSP